MVYDSDDGRLLRTGGRRVRYGERIVLLELARAGQPLTYEEIAERIGDRHPDVESLLHDLAESGVLVERAGLWAVAEHLSVLTTSAFGFGDRPINDATSVASQDDGVDDLWKRLRDRLDVPQYLLYRTLGEKQALETQYLEVVSSLASMHVGESIEPADVRRMQDLEKRRELLVQALEAIDKALPLDSSSDASIEQGQLYANLAEAVNKRPRWLRRLLAVAVPRRKNDSFSVITEQFKSFLDTIGPPPGWRPSDSRVP